jgi:hypothetical protein
MEIGDTLETKKTIKVKEIEIKRNEKPNWRIMNGEKEEERRNENGNLACYVWSEKSSHCKIMKRRASILIYKLIFCLGQN